jgi:hypothetical protein
VDVIGDPVAVPKIDVHAPTTDTQASAGHTPTGDANHK